MILSLSSCDGGPGRVPGFEATLGMLGGLVQAEALPFYSQDGGFSPEPKEKSVVIFMNHQLKLFKKNILYFSKDNLTDSTQYGKGCFITAVKLLPDHLATNTEMCKTTKR
ncbi:hypothetical protein GN956_G17174 [Arapaima gigas]